MTTLPGTITSPTAGPILADWIGPVEEYRLQPARDCSDVRRAWDLTPFDGRYLFRYDLAKVRLPLYRPEGRDHAARWLARHHGLTVGATAPVWQRIKGMDPSTIWSLSVRSDIDMDASPTVKVDQRGFVEPGAFPDSRIANIVPGISAITDPAEALRLAILAAAGVTP